jgi:hypothetical protein
MAPRAAIRDGRRQQPRPTAPSRNPVFTRMAYVHERRCCLPNVCLFSWIRCECGLRESNALVDWSGDWEVVHAQVQGFYSGDPPFLVMFGRRFLGTMIMCIVNAQRMLI